MVLESSTQSPKRKQVKRACTNCRTAKTGCSNSRPCKRCLSLKIGHLCSDAPPKKKTDSQFSSRSFDSITPVFATNIPPLLASPLIPEVSTTSSFSQHFPIHDNAHNINPSIGHLNSSAKSHGTQQSIFSQTPMPLFPIMPNQHPNHPQPQQHMSYTHCTEPVYPQMNGSYNIHPQNLTFQGDWQF